MIPKGGSMASVLLVCRDARADSILGNLALGLQLKESGTDVAVVFTGESLLALTGQRMLWPPLLQSREAQMQISRAGSEMGFALSAEFDGRWLDTDRFLRQAAGEGLELIACPFWTRLLGVEDALPAFITRAEGHDYLRALQSAERVIGAY